MAAVSIAAAVYAQLALLGANSDFLAALASCLDICVAISALWLVSAPNRFWLQLRAPGLIFAAAGLWALLGIAMAQRPFWVADFLSAAHSSGAALAPDRALLELAKLAGAGAVVLTGALIGASAERLNFLIRTLVLLGALETFVALFLFAADPHTVAGFSKGLHDAMFTGTLLNRNAEAAFLAALCQLTAGLFRIDLGLLQRTPSGARSRPILQLAVDALLLFLFAGACALTQSRSGLGAAALGLVLIMVWPLSRRSSRAPGQGRGKRRPGWLPNAGILVVLSCFAVGVVIAGAGALDRAAMLQSDFQDRMSAYLLIQRQIAASPWFGYGLGTAMLVTLHALTADLAPIMWNFGAVHNAWLQAALEGGVPYPILLTTAAIVIVWPAFRMRAKSSTQRMMRVSLAMALATILVCASVDIALNVPAIAALAMLVLGALGGSGRSEEANETSTRA